jgi:hypothetical protein
MAWNVCSLIWKLKKRKKEDLKEGVWGLEREKGEGEKAEEE